MYDHLEGEVASRAAARLVLRVGGVGYELAVPLLATFVQGQRARVWTHLVVREDSQQLFGFPDMESRDLFRLLITVTGVGPRVALGVLSGMPAADVVAAIRGGDAARLTSVRGVGRRIADQILLALREKIAQLGVPERAAGPAGASEEAARLAGIEDAVAALISIGFGEKDARRQVERVAAKVDARDLELLVRAALQG